MQLFLNDDVEPDFNYSQYDFPKRIWNIAPTSEILIKSLTFLPLVVFGCIGNGIMLYIILNNRALRTPTNYLIANMALANFLTVLVCPAMFLTNDIFQFYKLGPIGCKLEGFLDGAFLITAILNLCAISYDRLTAIVLPLETRLSLKTTKCVMFVIWIAGIFIASPLFIYRKYEEREWKNLVETYCAENNEVLPVYWHVLISFLVWFPLVVMIICYSAIFWKLDRYEKKVLKREHPISVSYKKKFAKTMFIILVSFVILRVPFTTLVFVRDEKLKEYQMNGINHFFYIFWYISHYLIFFNCSLDPIIYGVTNDNFRRAFKQSFWYSLCCCQYINCSHKNESKVRNFKNKNNLCLEPREPALAVIHQTKIQKQLKRTDGGWILSDKSPVGKTTNLSKTTKFSIVQPGVTEEISIEKPQDQEQRNSSNQIISKF